MGVGRSYIAGMYAPTREALEARTDPHRDVAGGANEGPTGWAAVDAKMGTLRRRVREAENADDFKAVGIQCVTVLEALGRAVFDPQRHLAASEDMPHANDAKTRLGNFLRGVTGGEVKKGERFEHVRTLIRATWRQAQSLKHRDDPNITDAGIAADSVALLVSIVRRLADEDQYYVEMADAAQGEDNDGRPQITTTLSIYTHLFDDARHADELKDRMAASAFARLLDPPLARREGGRVRALSARPRLTARERAALRWGT